MHLLARSVTGSTAAAFFAGLAWACWPYRTAHLLHLQLQALYFLPLALWALTRVAAGRRWRDAGWLGAFAGLQAIASVYYGVMTALALVVAAPVLAWGTGQWRGRRYWSRMVAAGLLAAVMVLPVAVPVPPIAGRRRVWPQPLRGRKSRGSLAELHAGAAGQRPLWALGRPGAAASGAGRA